MYSRQSLLDGCEGKTRFFGSRFLYVWIGLCLTLAAIPSWARIPEPDHTFFGTPTRNGVLIESGHVTLAVETGPVLAEYSLGSISSYGGRYVLRLPMSYGEPQLPGTARPGDSVLIYIDGELAARATVGDPGDVQLIDLDPFFEQTPELTIFDAIVAEGDAGSVSAEVEVRLSRPTDFDVSVTYSTADGTALAGEDYAAASGTLTIPAGSTREHVSIEVFGDTQVEPPERFHVSLSDPQDAVIATASAEVVIDADDSRFVLRTADTRILEGDGEIHEAVFLVTAEGEIPSARGKFGASVRVDYQTSDLTAVAGEDYEAVSGTLTIDTATVCPEPALPCGEIRIPIYPDNQKEGNEVFTLHLSNPITAVLDGSEAQAVIIDDERFLVYVESEMDGAGGAGDLDGIRGAVISPDGRHLYAAASAAGAVAVFERDVATGELSPTAMNVRDGENSVVGLAGAQHLAMSPDGLHLYAAGSLQGSIVVFERNALTGALTFAGRAVHGVGGVDGLDGVAQIAVSADGAQVVAVADGSDSLVVLSRDAGSGLLTYLVHVAASDVDVQGLNGARGLARYGDYYYVASAVDSTLTAFHVDPGTGLPTQVDVERDALLTDDGILIDGLSGATSVAISPDGSHVYVAGYDDDAVAVFERDGATGEVEFVERLREGFAGITGLESVTAVAVSADGGSVFATGEGESSLAVFSRAPLTGRLTLVETRYDGDPDPRGPVDGLGGAAALAVGPEADGRHLYVLGREDDGLAVFFRDLVAPEPPVVTSPTHGENTWVSSTEVTLQWTAVDNVGGIGISGYAYVLNDQPSTDPGIDLTRLDDASTDPETVTVTVGEGRSWFHIRACDGADNCSDTATYGAIQVDASPPSSAPGFGSTSHQVGVATDITMLELEWQAATDTYSGIAGYGVTVDPSSAPRCDQVMNIADPATVSASVELAAGTWYAHLCAVDQLGHWGVAAVAGPYVVDLTPPTVTDLRSVPSWPGGLAGGGWSEIGVTQILPSFGETLTGQEDASSYRLFEAGPDGLLTSTSCDVAQDDDVSWSIPKVFWDGDLQAPALQLGSGRALPAGLYRLVACADALADSAGNNLDGDGDGVAGGDYVATFEIGASNLLANPALDRGLQGWTTDSDQGIDPVADAEDIAGRATSGSAKWSQTDAPASRSVIQQCVNLDVLEPLALSGWARIQSDETNQPSVSVRVEYFATADCVDPLASTAWNDLLAGDTAGWIELPRLSSNPPSSAVSLRVEYVISNTVLLSGEVTFDNLYALIGDVIFSDGFENGDLSRWSFTSP